MNIEAPKSTKTKLHKIEVEGIEFIHSRPTVKDVPHCNGRSIKYWYIVLKMKTGESVLIKKQHKKLMLP